MGGQLSRKLGIDVLNLVTVTPRTGLPQLHRAEASAFSEPKKVRCLRWLRKQAGVV